jgi:hypothetical protein
MTEPIFYFAFMHYNQLYNGWVHPSDHLNKNGSPSSFHVVLNNVSFGHLSFDDCRWHITEERPRELVKLIGKQIEKHFQL